MGQTVTANEIKGRFATDFLQEVSQGQEPLIVRLEDGTAALIQQYEPPLPLLEEQRMLEPLPQYSVSIPEGWKEALYGHDGTGSAGADYNCEQESEEVNFSR